MVYVDALNDPKRLGALVHRTRFDFVSSYDLLISNWAYTELTPKLQEMYFKTFVSRSTHGFILGVVEADYRSPFSGPALVELLRRGGRRAFLDKAPVDDGQEVLVWGPIGPWPRADHTAIFPSKFEPRVTWDGKGR
eukprot:CAMPEP_0175913578 /NCGR_PEP_ID=MMETSP0108-20121206/9338_1 /TAXON_ID=195067 ORGANISM="Goniomonas pacifica, Strain CCMP1869" /NCGR_SAMPLE_ID=MMETSP0108 /ASSEMBLY_ACC=CAM_ASM_000204 /LENGTH=135 /DNA_ID=CAMNT_0017235973 /DNA_START=30 /DNA_END=437 /DNA_ORIENTATION=-